MTLLPSLKKINDFLMIKRFPVRDAVSNFGQALSFLCDPPSPLKKSITFLMHFDFRNKERFMILDLETMFCLHSVSMHI